MSRKLTALLAGLLLFFTAPVFADMQFSNNGTRAGQFRKVNLDATSGLAIANDGTISGTAGSPTFANVTDSALVAGRVVFAGTAGILASDSDMTFATDTLTITKLVASTSITDSGLTVSTALTANASGVLTSSSTTDTELGYVHNVTSAIQTQLNLLAPLASPTLTGTPAIAAATGTSLTVTGAVKFNTSLWADGDSETSSVLLSSSTSLGTSSMSFSDIYKSIGNQNETTLLHNGVGNGQISRFHVLAGNSGMIWTLTPDTSLNLTGFQLSVRGTEFTGIYVNSTIGWQPMGSTGTVTILYKSAAV